MSNIFVTMIGLEERGLGFFGKQWDFKIDDHVLFINREFENDDRVVSIGRKITRRFLDRRPVHVLQASYYDPFEIVQSFNRYVTESKLDMQSCSFFWDISNFNRQNLIVLMWLLRSKYRIRALEVFYTVPDKYNLKMSEGAKGFSTIPFLGGITSSRKGRLLVLLVGYETQRCLYLHRTLEPSKVILAQGDLPTHPGFLAANRATIDNLSDAIPGAEIAKVPAHDPHAAASALLDIFKEHTEDYNIVASPLNTKIQTVGLCLACEKEPDVQVVYSYPEKFSGWLSKGVAEIKRFKL